MWMRRRLKVILARIPAVRRYLAEKHSIAAAWQEAVAERDHLRGELMNRSATIKTLCGERDAVLDQLRLHQAAIETFSAELDAALRDGNTFQRGKPASSVTAPSDAFETNESDRPGTTRVLFIGHASSSHTHSWIGLLDGSGIEARLFSPFHNDSPAPGDFPVKTYMSTLGHTVPPPSRPGLNEPSSVGGWTAWRDARLAAVVESWRPHVVHTLGLFYAGLCWYSMHDRFNHRPRWVLQLRGGSDLQVNHRAPAKQDLIRNAARAADQIVSDNLQNFEILRSLGVDERLFASIAPVPGTGGMDVPAAPNWAIPTSRRSIIFCPKAYVP